MSFIKSTGINILYTGRTILYRVPFITEYTEDTNTNERTAHISVKGVGLLVLFVIILYTSIGYLRGSVLVSQKLEERPTEQNVQDYTCLCQNNQINYTQVAYNPISPTMIVDACSSFNQTLLFPYYYRQYCQGCIEAWASILNTTCFDSPTLKTKSQLEEMMWEDFRKVMQIYWQSIAGANTLKYNFYLILIELGIVENNASNFQIVNNDMLSFAAQWRPAQQEVLASGIKSKLFSMVTVSYEDYFTACNPTECVKYATQADGYFWIDLASNLGGLSGLTATVFGIVAAVVVFVADYIENKRQNNIGQPTIVI
mmetsp:Transcript_16821/g.23407  ORF Transcript_16821/g.23407 Transcript_16821/m.23407 type:complete len:313 (+) Transcript_16821:1-939(+)